MGRSNKATISLIVPTRRRVDQLRRLVDSLATTVAHPESIETVLVVDEDDPASREFRHKTLPVKLVVGPPGQTMGTLNSAGYRESVGRYIMLLNDDVIVRTRHWDNKIRAVFAEFPDDIALIHVNDTLIREHLCVFPIVSRRFCELVGGICPCEYVRYRIDDHIEDIFNLLAVLGERRAVYLPDVVFQHLNVVEQPEAGPVYMSDPAILALDGPRFDALFSERKELALRVMDYIDGRRRALVSVQRRRQLDRIRDPFSLRVPGRQQIRCGARAWLTALSHHVRACVRRRGYRGLFEAAGRRVLQLIKDPVISLPVRS
jgi:hypothetical protein